MTGPESIEANILIEILKGTTMELTYLLKQQRSRHVYIAVVTITLLVLDYPYFLTKMASAAPGDSICAADVWLGKWNYRVKHLFNRLPAKETTELVFQIKRVDKNYFISDDSSRDATIIKINKKSLEFNYDLNTKVEIQLTGPNSFEGKVTIPKRTRPFLYRYGVIAGKRIIISSIKHLNALSEKGLRNEIAKTRAALKAVRKEIANATLRAGVDPKPLKLDNEAKYERKKREIDKKKVKVNTEVNEECVVRKSPSICDSLGSTARDKLERELGTDEKIKQLDEELSEYKDYLDIELIEKYGNKVTYDNIEKFKRKLEKFRHALKILEGENARRWKTVKAAPLQNFDNDDDYWDKLKTNDECDKR